MVTTKVNLRPIISDINLPTVLKTTIKTVGKFMSLIIGRK